MSHVLGRPVGSHLLRLSAAINVSSTSLSTRWSQCGDQMKMPICRDTGPVAEGHGLIRQAFMITPRRSGSPPATCRSAIAIIQCWNRFQSCATPSSTSSPSNASLVWLPTPTFLNRRSSFGIHFCFILSTGTKIRIDAVMRPRSSSRGRNTSASVTVTITDIPPQRSPPTYPCCCQSSSIRTYAKQNTFQYVGTPQNTPCFKKVTSKFKSL